MLATHTNPCVVMASLILRTFTSDLSTFAVHFINSQGKCSFCGCYRAT